MVECAGLENRSGGNPTVSSNLTLSAIHGVACPQDRAGTRSVLLLVPLRHPFSLQIPFVSLRQTSPRFRGVLLRTPWSTRRRLP